MEDSILLYWSSVLLLLISLIAVFWAFYSAIFLPIQWLNPVGKTILITGCDSGIGLELAQHFHRKGSIVIATVLSTKSSGALQLEREFQNKSFLVELDVTELVGDDSYGSIAKIKQILEEKQLELFALINNAGVCVFGEFDFLTFDQIQHQINVNFLGTICLIKHLLPLIIKSKGRIINVSSVNALVPFPGISVYSATKKAIETFSESLAIEVEKFNVSVICIRLGDYAKFTNIMANHQQVIDSQWKSMTEEQRELHGDFFHKYHQSALKNAGFFSPKSYDDSSLFNDFDRVVYVVNPGNYSMSATLQYKLLIYFLYYIPAKLRSSLLRKFTEKML